MVARSETILATSFRTWRSHQASNSSDDLLAAIAPLDLPYRLESERRLPVDVALASDRVLARIEAVQPDAIACCGMAESRQRLRVESEACQGDRRLETQVDLAALVAGLEFTEIGRDAGKFVCEGLYYRVLEFLSGNTTPCIFVHVPILTADNLEPMSRDFLTILDRLLVVSKSG